MIFSSINFIYIFLPIFLLFYWLVPQKYANAVLFIGSVVFYAVGEHVWFVLMLLSLLVHYLLTRFSEGRSQKCRRFCLVLMLLYGFGTLFVFKYMGFFQDNWNRLAEHLAAAGSAVQLPVLHLPEVSLPIGISFYTFQIASYAIDVYRGDVKTEKSFVNLGAYLCMFPQLIAGPIVLYSEVSLKLEKRRTRWHHVENGLKTFVIGLSYKVLLANTFGTLWNQVLTWGVSSLSVALAWLGILAYTFQIYFDFQGYSMMAMGLGEILGFRLPRNFRNPYTAETVTDFWRRWHITLSRWFRNYVYIPLGGNRRGALRTIFNLLVVWVFTGLWHGASWNFLLWGIYYFVLLVFEKWIVLPAINRGRARARFREARSGARTGTEEKSRLSRGKSVTPRTKAGKIVGWIYTFTAVMVGWVIFAIEDLGSIREYLERMFLYFDKPEAWVLGMDSLVMVLKQYWPFLAAGAVCCTAWPLSFYRKNKKRPVTIAALAILLAVCTWRLRTESDNPFLYFRF